MSPHEQPTSNRPTRDSEPEDSIRSGGGSGPLHRVPLRTRGDVAETQLVGEPPVFPTRLFDRPRSVLVSGTSRPLVNLTLFALASATNPDFHWVEIGSPSEPRTPCDPIRLGWIPENRLWVVDPPRSLRPDDASASIPLHEMIRSDEPPDSIRHLTEFLRLPDLSQRILSSHTPNGRPGVVAVTNAQRVEEAFSAERVAPVLAVHSQAGFSVMVGSAKPAGRGRELFDFVFRLQGHDVEIADWKHNELVCERGISSGPLRELRPLRLDQIPLLAEVLSRARPAD